VISEIFVPRENKIMKGASLAFGIILLLTTGTALGQGDVQAKSL